jgi:hypothetical protein
VTVVSYLHEATGSCETDAGTEFLGYPVAAVGSLSTAFTPPYRIVTAESQMASVPTLGRLSHWLLAAALVAVFAVYDRTRLRRLGASGA